MSMGTSGIKFQTPFLRARSAYFPAFAGAPHQRLQRRLSKKLVGGQT